LLFVSPGPAFKFLPDGPTALSAEACDEQKLFHISDILMRAYFSIRVIFGVYFFQNPIFGDC